MKSKSDPVGGSNPASVDGQALAGTGGFGGPGPTGGRIDVLQKVTIDNRPADGKDPVAILATATSLATEKNRVAVAGADVQFRVLDAGKSGPFGLVPAADVQQYYDRECANPIPPGDYVQTNENGETGVFITCTADAERTYIVRANVIGLNGRPIDISFNDGHLDVEIHFTKPTVPIITD